MFDFFFKEENQAYQDASPLRFSGGEYSFVHKSIYEYFTSIYLWNTLTSRKDQIVSHWQVRLLTEERPCLAFLSELYSSLDYDSQQNVKNTLFEVVNYSKDASFSGVVASTNSITYLNTLDVSMDQRDFKGVRIPNADLSYSRMAYVDFEVADLTNVNFSSSYLAGANFKSSSMQGVNLGEWPKFTGHRGSVIFISLFNLFKKKKINKQKKEINKKKKRSIPFPFHLTVKKWHLGVEIKRFVFGI